MRRAQPWRSNRSRALRARATSAESRLWFQLRNRQLDGMKFVRQSPVGPYFVDFLCRERKLIVEIDGATHSADADIAHDLARENWLRAHGYRIFRASNTDVYDNMSGVIEALSAFADRRMD